MWKMKESLYFVHASYPIMLKNGNVKLFWTFHFVVELYSNVTRGPNP